MDSIWQARLLIPVPRPRNWFASSHLRIRAEAIVILSRILEHKKAELRHKQSRGYLSELKAKIQDAPGPLGFAVTLEATRTGGNPSLIAEVKKTSPSLGFRRPALPDPFDYLEIANASHTNAASAPSVLP